MVETAKPEIVKSYNYGTYQQETPRVLKSFINDIKRFVHQIENKTVSPLDKDIELIGQSLKVLGLQFELTLAYKFPEACDCSIADLKKHYNIQI